MLWRVFLLLFVSLDLVDSEARECYFGPPPKPDPDNPDPNHWMKQVMGDIRKNCPGRRRQQPTPAPMRKLVCEKDVLSISCDSGEVIDVQRALYGREEGSTDCEEGNVVACGDEAGSLHFVQTTCQGQRECFIYATNDNYGSDPCLNVGKYLVVDYVCSPQ